MTHLVVLKHVVMSFKNVLDDVMEVCVSVVPVLISSPQVCSDCWEHLEKAGQVILRGVVHSQLSGKKQDN